MGPNVGDITIRYDPPRRGRVIPMAIQDMKPKTTLEDGGSVKGPKPKGDSRPVEINRHMYVTCIVRQE